jgi:hypothetical protein
MLAEGKLADMKGQGILLPPTQGVEDTRVPEHHVEEIDQRQTRYVAHCVDWAADHSVAVAMDRWEE